LVHRPEFERELVEVCQRYGLGVIPYSPLAGGFLTGKYRKGQIPDSARARGAQRYFSERNWMLLDEMESLGKDKGGKSISQIALAWLLTDPTITSPIIGPRTMEQLEDNLGALGLRLTQQEKERLDKTTDWQNQNPN
jgi:aryl-alcohol dehydrogenase-like predicted oxidoreductase